MRAQVWSLDLAISALIFFTALAVVIFTWNYAAVHYAEQAELKEIETMALSVSEQVIRTPGMPENWESGSIDTLGLATEENVLNDSKIEGFLSLDYQDAKSLLGVGAYEFQFQIRQLNNTLARTISGTEISSGMAPSNERLVVPVSRYCMLNGEIARLELIIWAGF